MKAHEVITWIKQFRNITTYCKCNVEEAVQNLHIMTEDGLHPIIERKRSVDTAFNPISALYFPRERFPEYQKELQRMKISKYKDIYSYCNRLYLLIGNANQCLSKGEGLNPREIYNYFYNGLSYPEKRHKLKSILRMSKESRNISVSSRYCDSPTTMEVINTMKPPRP